MADINNTNAEPNQQQSNATPAATGEPAATGKTFTQDEVNRIVSDRLAREKAKSEPTAADTREKELDERENKLKCRELIAGSKGKYPEQFLDILDTSNADSFQKLADKLIETFPRLSPNAPHIVTSRIVTPGGKDASTVDVIAQAFKKH